jgi:hypothetical protein
VRREYKYLVDEATAERVRQRIRGICERDRYTDERGRYLCDTLYLDSLDMRLYRATVENEAVRHKLRIRTYPGTNLAFLEVKRRVDDVIVKSRAMLGPEWRTVLETANIDSVPEAQRKDVESFLSYYHASRLGPMVPTVLVRYEREPYSSLIDPYARVTFDRSLQYQVVSDLVLHGDDRAWVPIDNPLAMRGSTYTSLSILELKFESRAPGWMTRLVQSLEIPRLSMSKYTRAIESMMMRPSTRAAIL